MPNTAAAAHATRRVGEGLPSSSARGLLLACISLAAAGCARDVRPGAVPAGDRTKAAFTAARDRCGITVVETPAVLDCMRAQGWAYRHPWQ